MQRYTVTIVHPGNTGERPVLLVPFEPSAIVTAFIDELYKRVAKRGLPITPNTHIATLHLDGETGAIIDCEDVLSDVITDPKSEKVFAVFAKNPKHGGAPSISAQSTMSASDAPNGAEEGSMSIRIVTPATAKTKQSCPILHIPATATIRHLYERVAGSVNASPSFEDDAETYECNCKLANQLADGSCPADSFLVVHGKSNVERLQLSNPTEAAMKEALRRRFGVNFETTKRAVLVGAEVHPGTSTYKKPPVAAVCSKQRHTPVHARLEIDDGGDRRSKVLDLHTSEQPIHPACMDTTLEDAGISELAVDGVIEVFAVNRSTTSKSSAAIGKSSIFRARAHWEPSVMQSDRGMAMFLSSLRVFASLVQDMRTEERSQDAVLHVFDLLTNFPPALRTLHILVQGKTPTAVDSAALSQAMFEVLDSFVPTDIIGSDHRRVFEGARLLFGFILEKARALRLPEGGATYPYLSAFQSVDVRDYKTNEAVMYALQTSGGLVESSLFDAFQGVLSDSHLQSFMVKSETDSTKVRHALLSGGVMAEIPVFSLSKLAGDYRYADAGITSNALDLTELPELSHLAELCGRNKLAVHKPSQLASAVAPCLTFDRSAHLAVYTGEQPCGDPGRSSILFRPQHGEEAVDTAVIEQLIAPILQVYESNGTAVFDALGGAAVRRLQAPDEVLMFCVDTSASMRQATDFEDVNDTELMEDEDPDAGNLVASEFYNKTSFDDIKERICSDEGFADMVAIVAEAGGAGYNRRTLASRVLDILRTMLSSQIIKQTEKLAGRRQYARGWHYARREIGELEAELDKLKAFWAGLKTHEEATLDFLIYRATAASSGISQRWTWSLGDAVPSSGHQPQQIPSLPFDITEMPHHLRCPISHTLMEDAVTASDGHTYSHTAIGQWFRIRSSSPMTGLELQNTALTSNTDISDAAARWADGDGIPGREDGNPSKRLRSSNEMNVTFDSRGGSFSRNISPSMSLADLYKLAFRGMKARSLVFQLSTERYGPLTMGPGHVVPEATVTSRNIKDGDHITIRIAEDEPDSITTTASSNSVRRSSDLVLVKVYEGNENMLFAYWVKQDTTQRLATLIWKYWRHTFLNNGLYSIYNLTTEKQVWTDMNHSGDGLLTGSPQKNTDMLSTYLTRRHCFGKLAAEKVYREDAGVSDGFGLDPMVLKVKICGPWKPKLRDNRLTRLDVLKQMFEALVNRMLAYNYKTHVGLVTFASTPNIAMSISHVLENFRRATTDMEAEGDTALWDGIAIAKDQLVEYGKKYPDAKKRIIVISDGADTKSTSNTCSDITWRLRNAEIAVDTVSLGSENNVDLRTVSYLLGCYRFHPTSLVNALSITEMEPVLSLTERPTITPPTGTPKQRLQFMSHFWTARHRASSTLVDEDNVPPRKEHPNLRDEFVQLTVVTARPASATASGNTTRSNLRISRLMNEMRLIAAGGAHPKYDVYVSETDMSFWKIVMEGPEESPYSEGTFLLYLHADEGYPTFAPKARFITKIKHPNVNAHGRICHSIFDRDWTSDTSMPSLLDTVYGLLYQPEHSDPVNTTTTLGFHHDEVEFADEVREFVDEHALKSRDDWRKELLGEEDEELEESDEDEEGDEGEMDDEGDEDEMEDINGDGELMEEDGVYF